MKSSVVLSGVMVSVLLVGVLVCQAEKWDKNNFDGNNIEAGYYNADSIKVEGKLVSWTEKYVYTDEGVKLTADKLSKYPACKQSIAKNGNATQFQVDYQIESGRKYRGVAKRYYNKKNEVICTDKDQGKEFDTSWARITRSSPMENAFYDLVSKYKVVVK